MKRKASKASPDERPSKLAKSSTSSGVEMKRDDTLPRTPLSPVKLGSKKKSTTTPSEGGRASGDVVGLRRAPTLPLVEEKSSDGVSAGDPVTTVRRLPSGTSVGSTSAEGIVPKLTSKKSSLIRKESMTKAPAKSSRENSAVVPPPLPPGGLMEIVFSFDTTGSMSSCLEQVRGRVSDMMQRLQADIPGIRLSVFAHGDYIDARKYVTKWIDFGATLPELCDFVKNVESTGGGDFEECYELVLHQVGKELSWTPGSQRSLVMIGDATPHGPNYPDNKLKLVWQDECKRLKEMGVRIYSVQALNNSSSTTFYSSMAALTDGIHLKLDQFSNIFDLIMAICYREGGVDLLQAYEDEVRGRHVGGALNKDLEKLFVDLRTDGDSTEDDLPRPKGKAVKTAHAVITPAPRRKPKAVNYPHAVKKSPKGVKSPKAKSKGKNPAKSVKKNKTVGKKFRENVSEKEFRQQFPKITWSPWYLGLSSERPDTGSWVKRSAGTKPGFRRKGHLTCNAEGPRVFEVGVQVRPRGKIHATYVGKRSAPKSGWGVTLLGASVMAKQINAVLSGKARVYVRFGKARLRGKKAQSNTIDKTMATATRAYDYAWMKNRRNKKPRSVKKTGTKISYEAV